MYSRLDFLILKKMRVSKEHHIFVPTITRATTQFTLMIKKYWPTDMAGTGGCRSVNQSVGVTPLRGAWILYDMKGTRAN